MMHATGKKKRAAVFRFGAPFVLLSTLLAGFAAAEAGGGNQGGPVSTGCVVTLGECEGGDCVVNVGTCNGGGCTVNLGGICKKGSACVINTGVCRNGGTCAVNTSVCSGECIISVATCPRSGDAAASGGPDLVSQALLQAVHLLS